MSRFCVLCVEPNQVLFINECIALMLAVIAAITIDQYEMCSTLEWLAVSDDLL